MKTIKERLITYAEKKVIKKAVAILKLSDEHDDLFYQEMAKSFLVDASDGQPICVFGNYAVVKCKQPQYQEVCRISTVNGGVL